MKRLKQSGMSAAAFFAGFSSAGHLPPDPSECPHREVSTVDGVNNVRRHFCNRCGATMAMKDVCGEVRFVPQAGGAL